MEFEFSWVKSRLNTDRNCHLDCCVVYFLPNADEWMRIRTTKSVAFSCYCAVAAAAKSLQSCPTLCDPIDSSPLGSPVPGILQARTLEWVAISFSNAWKWEVKVKSLSGIQLLATTFIQIQSLPLEQDVTWIVQISLSWRFLFSVRNSTLEALKYWLTL